MPGLRLLTQYYCSTGVCMFLEATFYFLTSERSRVFFAPPAAARKRAIVAQTLLNYASPFSPLTFVPLVLYTRLYPLP